MPKKLQYALQKFMKEWLTVHGGYREGIPHVVTFVLDLEEWVEVWQKEDKGEKAYSYRWNTVFRDISLWKDLVH